jgi:hypothetical protein
VVEAVETDEVGDGRWRWAATSRVLNGVVGVDGEDAEKENSAARRLDHDGLDLLSGGESELCGYRERGVLLTGKAATKWDEAAVSWKEKGARLGA